MSETLLDRLEAALALAVRFNENAEVAPVALLWPDRERQFEHAIEPLSGQLPLVRLGQYLPSDNTGPAYWLRCAIAGTVDVELPDGIPVVYLPGVGREDLRAIESCPRDLAPIAELQYRGRFFSHPNGRDWSVRGLLASREVGLSLDIAEDQATTSSLVAALGELLDRPTSRLESQRIDASLLQRLLSPDPVEAILQWLDDPQRFQARRSQTTWNVFAAQCTREFDLDPASDGPLTAGRKLGERKGGWQQVWARYARNPEAYPGVEERLRAGKPQDVLFAGAPDAWPQDNDDLEAKLRTALARFGEYTASEARDRIAALVKDHEPRRGWVWARLGRAPLAFALEHLEQLATLTAGNPAPSLAALVGGYVENGWQADAAFLQTLLEVREPTDRDAVQQAALALYRPWLEAQATALQGALGPNASDYQPGPPVEPAPGTVTMFVDGLRLDVAHRLQARLGSFKHHLDVSLAALPTVTDTAKPALAPLPDNALVAGAEFAAARATSSRAKADVGVLRSLMLDRGVQILKGAEVGDLSGSAWTEAGDIDKRGHEFGAALVDELDNELASIARRITMLLEAGWQTVEVVTDHGWLLVPGGMAKVDLPVVTVVKRKGRCARLKDGASVEVLTVPWHWDPHVDIALAPGITCFEAGKEYEHGGISLQECVVPRLKVSSGKREVSTGGAAIAKVKWLGLMCRIEVEHVAPVVTVDIRARPGEPSTSVAEDVKETTSSGKQALFVADEDLEGEKAFIVIVTGDGTILAQREVIIGRNG
jgi:hypothetical protein